MTHLAASLGISDVALGKACRRALIPVPPRGHWARVAASNERPPTPPLPARGLGQAELVTFGFRRWPPSDAEFEHLPPAPSYSESLEALIEQASRFIGKGRVSRGLEPLTPAVAKVMEADEVRRRKCAESAWHWDKPKLDTPEAQRRLKILNALGLLISRTDAQLIAVSDDALSARVCVGEQHLSFVFEYAKKSARQKTRTPNLTFRLEVSVAQWEEIATRWSDEAGHRIEEELRHMAVSALVFGELAHRASAIRQHQWLVERRDALHETARREAEAREQARREARQRRQNAQIKQLLAASEALRQSEAIRALVDAMAAKRGVDADEAFLSWKRWALEQADRLDPRHADIGGFVRSFTPDDDDGG
ncbi:hypothetical protein [Niveibacterium umoris]|uniref:Uncharacterized protein n=1 Tax=Niveibacterium umoris TaxID=1193620 RepID=A0A840BS42_9RHOO|nr:hypothetical protein [Niveibacterium umoris]MBB4013646.1 hypothetical protein [Niveibacterium umoris]